MRKQFTDLKISLQKKQYVAHSKELHWKEREAQFQTRIDKLVTQRKMEVH